jgi:hypothetical protein
LPRLGRKNDLKGSKHQDEEEEAEARRECERVQVHGRGPGYRVIGEVWRLGKWREDERPVCWARERGQK